MKILHLKSGDERIVTKEQWATIVSNGFASDFKVLADPEVPKEVRAALKQTADTKPEQAKEH